MCKLFSILDIEHRRNAENFSMAAVPYITATDNHGLGIMRLGENGIHIQRWLEPPKVVSKKINRGLEKYKDALMLRSNADGMLSNDLYAIAIHGRFATCARSLENVHPFYREGTALMHNGVISNADNFDRPLSTCDSEALLTRYIDARVKDNPTNLSTALKDIHGYYGAIVFNDNGIVDIWRDGTATLYMARVKHVGTVIATTQEIILKTAKICKARILGIEEISPFINIRWRLNQIPRITSFEGSKYKAPDLLTAFDTTESKRNYVSESNGLRWWELEDILDKEGKKVKAWSEEACRKMDRQANDIASNG